MELVFRPEAELEILEAQSWYEGQSSGLGFEFARAVEAAVAVALRNPFACPPIDAEFRHVILRRFPYSLIFTAGADELLVVSCFHHHREPDTWRNG